MMNCYPKYKSTDQTWIARIPAHWDYYRAKRIFDSPKEKNIGNSESNVLSLTLQGVIRNNKDRPIGLSPEDYATYQIFEPNDLVFKLIDLENISTSRVGVVSERGIMSSAYIRFSAKADVNIRYFYFQYYDLWLRCVFNGLGAGVRQTLSADDLRNMKIMVPPREEQDQIVRYIDWKTSYINKLINAKRKQIALIEEKKQFVIDSSVTRGLRGNTTAHNDNIDWIENIPSNWEAKRIKYLFKMRDKRNYLPLSEVNLLSLYTKLGVVQNSDVEYKCGNKARTAEGYKIVERDDIIVNIILCWMGAIGRSAYSGVTSPAYDIYTPLQNVSSKYYHYLFRTSRFSGQCYIAGRGIMAMRWRTYSSQFRNIYVPVPSFEEQLEIANYLDNFCNEQDSLISKIEKEIKLLQEYRTCLISNIVTGKIDIRTIEIPEYDEVKEMFAEEFINDELDLSEVD